MIKIALVRGSYLNNFEGQSYVFPKGKIVLTGVASLFPIHKVLPFPIVRLPSIEDVGRLGKIVKYLCNRTIGDSQILFGLERLQERFDIFHSADPHYYYSYQLAKLRAAGKIRHLIMTSWETIPFNNESVLQKRTIKRYSRNRADFFVCYTNRAKECLITEGVDPDRIKVVRLGVDIKRFRPKVFQTKKKSEITILFVGRLVEDKGVLDLYHAFKRLVGVRLMIIGEGPLKAKLERIAREDGVVKRLTIDTRRYTSIHEVYRKADIFVLPSKRTKTWEEQYGMVLVEAMASGLPIISYASGAIPEVVGEAGILVKEGDRMELTGSLVRLLGNENLMRKLGTMGRERAKKEFDCIKTAKKIQKIYETVIGGNYS